MFKLDHLGHWCLLNTPQMQEEVDLGKYIGFVYVMSFEDGSKYIGAKKIWKRITKPPCTFKRGPNKGFEQSNWRDYTSSSNVVNEMIDNGIEPSEYLIVGFYDSWGKTLYAEALLQIGVNIFGNDIWLNNQIEGHFTRSCYDDSVLENNKCYIDYLLGAQIGVIRHDITLDIESQGKLIKDAPMNDLMPYEPFKQLIEGRIDEYNNITLPINIRRKTWKYKYKNRFYNTQKELKEVLDIPVKDWEENGVITNPKIESRQAYISRLNIQPKVHRRLCNGRIKKG